MASGMPAPEGTEPSPRRRGPRPRYSREDVARAAVAIADSDGLDAVTFRAVAARLGTGVMSLYNYVPDKQALVYEMTELVGAELVLQSIKDKTDKTKTYHGILWLNGENLNTEIAKSIAGK